MVNVFHDGVPNYSNESGAFGPDFSCRSPMIKNHDFVDGSRRGIIVVRISTTEQK